MKRALISVSNKTGITKFANQLLNKNWQIISTGGTYSKLTDNLGKKGIVSVEEYYNSAEFLGGRVKTLNEAIHAGILAKECQFSELDERSIPTIDMVVGNLYPFEKIVKDPNCEHCEAIENIDIGGVTMLRGAAKNYKRVIVISDPEKYDIVNTLLDNFGNDLPECEKKQLALETFKLTSRYDTTITEYLSQNTYKGRFYEKSSSLKYGCNPHQKHAATWKLVGSQDPFTVLNGSPSYINYLDAIGSWQLANELHNITQYPSAASFKHTSPAGAAIGFHKLSRKEEDAYEVFNESLSPQALAYTRARNGDPKSSFGDFIACSSVVDVSTAKVIQSVVSDGIVAPFFDPFALEILKKKKSGKFIILQVDPNYKNEQDIEFRELFGMALSQQPDTEKVKTDELLLDVDDIVAMVSLKYSQSNSVAFAKNGQIVGLGCGQQNRVDCVKLAGKKSEIWRYRLSNSDYLSKLRFNGLRKQDRINKMYEKVENSPKTLNPPEPLDDGGLVMASDGFFPFDDNIREAHKFGVTRINQPGGSTADSSIDATCKKLGIEHFKTGRRLFYH